MKKMRRLVFAAVLVLFATSNAVAYKLIYKEQIYELYHVQLYQYPERIAENIHWIKLALRADFANPLYALAEIEHKRDWERYRYLFNMHLNLKLVELYLRWGSKYNKEQAYFYNYPWKQENLDSLIRAEDLFNRALRYWEEAQRWSDRAAELSLVHLEEIQAWADESYRIQRGSLDYEAIIKRHLSRLRQVREDFQNMDADTY